MADLAEWSAQALRYGGSDGPVRVIYARSRSEIGTSDSFDEYPCHKVKMDSSKEVAYQGSGESALGALLSGQLFKPKEVPDSKDCSSLVEKLFEDKESALQDLDSEFNRNISRVLQFDLESFWDWFFDSAKNAKVDEEPPRDKPLGFKKEEKEKKEEEDGSNKRKLEEKKKKDEEKRREEKKKKIEESIKMRKELKDANDPRVRLCKLYAFISGITTEFNPSGTWIVEEFFYDEEVK